MESLLIEDIIKTIVIAITILISVSFSLWYSTKLSLFKIISFKYSLYVALITLVSIGVVRTSLKILFPDFKGLTPLFISILFGLLVETFSIKFFFKESYTKSFITAFFSFIVSIIIVVPLIVSAGFLMAYMIPPSK